MREADTIEGNFTFNVIDDDIWLAGQQTPTVIRFNLLTGATDTWRLLEGAFATSISKKDDSIWITVHNGSTHIIEHENLFLHRNGDYHSNGLSAGQLSSFVDSSNALWLSGQRLYRLIKNGKFIGRTANAETHAIDYYDFQPLDPHHMWALTSQELQIIKKDWPFDVVSQYELCCQVFGFQSIWQNSVALGYDNKLAIATTNADYTISITEYNVPKEMGGLFDVIHSDGSSLYTATDKGLVHINFDDKTPIIKAISTDFPTGEHFRQPILSTGTQGATYFVTSLTGGLYRLDDFSLTYVADVSSVSQPGKIEINDVAAIGDKILFGTLHHGLFIYDIAQNEFQKSSISPTSILSIESSNITGYFWLAMRQQAGLYDIASDNLVNLIGASNGLENVSLYNDASFKDNTGTVYFGGPNGFVSIDSDYPSMDVELVPPIATVNQIDYQPASMKHFRLEHAESHIQLGIASTNFDFAGTLNYRFKIKDIHKDWFDVPVKTGILDLTTLPSGKHTVQFQAFDSLGNESPISSIKLTKLASPWLRPESILGYVFVLFLIASFGISRHYRRIKTDEAALKDAVEMRTKALHEEHEKVAALLEKQRALTRYKEDFIAIASHEIKAPLSTMQYAVSKLPDNDELISSTSIRSKLLKNKEITNLSALARRMVEQSKFYADERRTSLRLYMEEEVAVECYTLELELLLSNLLTNAIRHSNGYTVTISVSSSDNITQLSVSNLVEDASLTREIFARVFEHDIPPDDKGGNKRLGLLIIKNIADIHDTKVNYSLDGNNLQVSIAFPRIYESCYKRVEEWAFQEHNDMAQSEETRAIVLFIDDCQDLHDIIESHLGKKFALFHALDGIHALECLSKHTPDVIVIDANMPNMDGAQFLEKLRTNSTLIEIPTVVLTAEPRIDRQAQLLTLGADVILEKNGDLTLLTGYLEQFSKHRSSSDASNNKMPSASQQFKASMQHQIESTIQQYYLDMDFDVKALCNLVGLSYRTCVRRVAEFSSFTPQELIFYARCEKAKLLMADGEKTEFVADKTGFSSSARMRHWFNRFYQKSPREFR